MTINISIPDVGPNLHPQITVLGVGGSGGNAVNNMISSNLEGVDFIIANTDAQALQISNCKKKIQLGIKSTRGLGAGMRPDIGRIAAEETLNEISEMLEGSHMLFIAAGMGGGTGTGAAPVIAKLAREKGILTVGVVTKPFHFEGSQRMKLADKGLEELQQYVDTLLTIPNQNLFRIANEKTTFADAFKMADDVLYAGVRGVTDLMVQPGLINLDFSDVKTVMSEMGKAMMGTGEASGEGRAVAAAEAAIANPLIDDVSLRGAKGLIINITGGSDITLYEVDEAANRIKEEVDESANIIYGTTCDERLDGLVRVSLVATGIDVNSVISPKPLENISTLSIDNSVYIPKSDLHDASSNTDIIHVNDDVGNENKEISIDESSNENLDFENKFESDMTFNNDTLNPTTDEIIESSLNSNLANETDTFADDNLTLENINNLENNKLDDDESEDLTKDSSLDSDIDNVEESQISDESISDESTKEESLQTSVRRLSLFDSLETSSTDHLIRSDEISKNIINSSEKTEPIFEADTDSSSSKNENFTDDDFLDEKQDINEEFNQETEEELLDIPTFLRRQAN